MINHVVKNEDGSVTVRPSTQSFKEGSIGVVPADIPQENWQYLKAEEVDDENGLKKWEFTVDLAAQLADAEEKVEAENKQMAYKAFISDIYDKMYDVFGTRRTETATADFETWKKMVQTPATFTAVNLKVPAELKDDSGAVIFDKGDVLDTPDKVSDYAIRKLEQADAYAVYRLAKKQEYADSL